MADDMDVNVGIALYSVMVTVISFLTGFLVIFASQLLLEFSKYEGTAEGIQIVLGREKDPKWRKINRMLKRVFRVCWLLVFVMLIVASASIGRLMLYLSEVGPEGWEDSLIDAYPWFVGAIGVLFIGVCLLVYLSGAAVRHGKRMEALIGMSHWDRVR